MRRCKGIILSALAAALLGSVVQLQALAMPLTGQNLIMNTQTVPTEGDTSKEKETQDASQTKETGDSSKEVQAPQTTGVAQVTTGSNTVSYETITEAWRAAANSKTATIKLLKNVSTGTEGQEGTCVLSGGNITLDMNGYQWTYTNGEGASGSKDMIEVSGSKASLTVKGGQMRYEDGGNGYAGACLYATDGAKLTIESGNFASNVGPVVYTEDAKVAIKGGKYANTASTGSKIAGAVSVHGGTLSVSGGEMNGGGLAIDNQGDDLEVALSGGKFARITSTAGSGSSKKALTIGELLADGYAFKRTGGSTQARSAKASTSTGRWVTDSADLESTSISNVEAAESPVGGTTFSFEADKQETIFPYGTQNTVKLTATIVTDMADIKAEDITFTWTDSSVSGSTPTQPTETTGNTFKSVYTFNTEQKDVGTYTVRVVARIAKLNFSWNDSIDIRIDPVSGTMTSSKLQTQYTYGDKGDDLVSIYGLKENNGNLYFDVVWDGTAPATDLIWSYDWGTGRNEVPVNAGTYPLVVTAKDKSGNHQVKGGPFMVTIRPKEVTPRIGNNVISKIYDGTTRAPEGVIIALDGLLTSDEGKVTAAAASITYEDEKVGTRKWITATDIALRNDGGNYVLGRTTASLDNGEITEAKLIMEISHSPDTQKINRPVAITVRLFYSADDTPMTGNWIKPEDITLLVSDKGGAEKPKRVTLKGVSGEYGVFTGTYTTDVPGDKDITATLGESSNYVLSSTANDNSLTIIEKGDSAMKLTTDRTMLTYGESATYTAEISSVDPDDKDSMAGTVQFYQGFVTDENRVGEPQNIPAAGGKASITLDKSSLTAGEQWIYAVYSGNKNFTEARSEVASTVAKKQLTWNSSDLSAYKTAGTFGEAGVYGHLTVDGIIDEGVTLTVSNTMVTSGFADTIIAGNYTVQAIPRVGIWNFTPQYLPNYDLPSGNPDVAAKVTSVTELANPPKDKDGLEYKMVMEEGLSSVPGELKGTSFGTPEEIRQELIRILTKKNGYTEKNIEVYDVVLQVSEDKGETWYEADVNSYPTKSLTVTIPYPAGTKSDGYDFIAAHMFASTDFNKVPGMIEQPKVKETSKGLVIKVTGLSPIGIAWKTSAKSNSSNSSSSNNSSSRSSSNSSSSRNTSGSSQSGGASGGQSGTAQAGGTGGTPLISSIGALTWDDNPILLYACLAAGTGLVLIITGSILIVKKRKR